MADAVNDPSAAPPTPPQVVIVIVPDVAKKNFETPSFTIPTLRPTPCDWLIWIVPVLTSSIVRVVEKDSSPTVPISSTEPISSDSMATRPSDVVVTNTLLYPDPSTRNVLSASSLGLVVSAGQPVRSIIAINASAGRNFSMSVPCYGVGA